MNKILDQHKPSSVIDYSKGLHPNFVPPIRGKNSLKLYWLIHVHFTDFTQNGAPNKDRRGGGEGE